MLEGNECPILPVSYRNFKGDITLLDEEKKDSSKIRVSGILNPTGNPNEFSIEELPIGVWTEKYTRTLDGFIQDKTIRHYKQYHTEHSVRFVVQLEPSKSTLSVEQLEDLLKLKRDLTNLFVTFDTKGNLKTFQNSRQMCSEFFTHRLEKYSERKQRVIGILQEEIKKKQNVIRFIKCVIKQEIRIYQMETSVVQQLMKSKSFTDIDCLLNLSIKSFNPDHLAGLEKKLQLDLMNELESLQKTSPQDMWKQDLNELEGALRVWEEKWKSELDEDLLTLQTRKTQHPKKKHKRTTSKQSLNLLNIKRTKYEDLPK